MASLNGYTLITRDVGFGSVRRFPLGTHPGIVVVRFPNRVTTGGLNAAIVEALRIIPEQDIAGNVVVIEPGSIRIRRGTET